MYKFKKILVGLDQSETDDRLLEAVCKVCELSGSKDIYFANFLKDFSVPDSVLAEFPDILNKAIEERQKEIESKVKEKFSCNGVTPHFVIKSGQPTKEIIKFAVEKKIDLIVLGRKGKKGGGILINRLARRASCSLLIIPTKNTLELKRLLVPIDFSPYSKLALEKGIEIAKYRGGDTKVITQNVYQVPSGYHYTGKSFQEFADIMMENAFKDFQVFTSDIDKGDVDVDSVYSLDKDEDIIKQIYKTAKKTKSDVILIGAKGRSATTALFIGSKAEKLIQMDEDIPVFVIRPKGTTAGFTELLEDI